MPFFVSFVLFVVDPPRHQSCMNRNWKSLPTQNDNEPITLSYSNGETWQTNYHARILVMRGYKTGRSVAGPVYLGEDPLRLARPNACGSLQTPHTVTRHNLRGRATDQLDVGLFGATYLAASL